VHLIRTLFRNGKEYCHVSLRLPLPLLFICVPSNSRSSSPPLHLRPLKQQIGAVPVLPHSFVSRHAPVATLQQSAWPI